MRGYHYTNPEAWENIHSGRMYGKTGLLPIRRFVRLDRGKSLPDEAHGGVIEGLLEPIPSSWIDTPSFPNTWRSLMHDICREKEIMLLSFDIEPSDRAFVVERANVERVLYQKAFTGRAPTHEEMNAAYAQYWSSRVPALQYAGEYTLPQLAVWSTIPTERLTVEWVKPHNELWKQALAISDRNVELFEAKNRPKVESILTPQ